MSSASGSFAVASQKPDSCFANRFRRFPLRKMTYPVKNDPSILPGKEIFFAFRRGRIVTWITATVDHQGRNGNNRTRRKRRFNDVVNRITRSQPPTHTVRVQGYLGPIGILEGGCGYAKFLL